MAQERTEDGAKAFLTFFFDEYNRGTTAPGTVDLFAISDPECKACDSFQEGLKKYVEGGLYLKQPSLLVTDSELLDLSNPAEVATAEKTILNFTLQQRPLPTYQGDKEIGDLNPYTRPRKAAIHWINGAWRMYAIGDPNA